MRAVAVAVVLALTSVSRADEPHPDVSLTLDACVEVDLAEVRRIVAVELGARLVDGAGDYVTRVTVTCEPGALRIAVDDPITGKRLERRLVLTGTTPSARARLLGLVAVESVVASWAELEAAPAKSVVVPSPSSPVAKRAAANAVRRRRPPEPARRGTLALLFVTRGFREAPRMIGLGLAPHWALGGGWGVAADLLVERGADQLAPSDVETLVVSSAPRGTLDLGGTPVGVRLSLGFRLGVARLSGAPTDVMLAADTVTGPWGGPMAGAELQIRPTAALVFGVGVETGVAVLSVRGDLGPDAADGSVRLGGTWATLWLGVGLEL